MSLLEILSNNELRLSLIAGVTVSSYFFCANLGAAYFGIVPAIQNPETPIPVSTKVLLWKYFYDTAKYHFATSTLVSGVSFASAAYFAATPSLRNLCMWASACSIAVGPFTMYAMLPVNNELNAIHNSGKLLANEKEGTAEGKALAQNATKKIAIWRKLHLVRLTLGASAWISGLVAIGYNL